MKTPALFSLDPALIARVHTAAADVGVPKSTLVAYLIQVGFAERPMDHIRRWATAHRQAHTRPGGLARLAGSERRMLAELGAEWIEVRLPGKVQWRALQGLRTKGLAEVKPYEGTAIDSNGRPVVTYWRRALEKQP